MKWFRKWMLGSLRKASAEERSEIEDTVNYEDDGTVPMTTYAGLSKNINTIKKRRGLVVASSDIDLPEGGLNIQVKSAIGGKIIIFRTYDDRNDRNLYSTYLIPDSENFQESLGKIITMESLKL
jgi:hypothetical protein